jgi:hypothetical protein
MAIANAAARQGLLWADTLFWSGLVLLIVPIARRLCSIAPTETERLGLVVMLAMSIYLVKLMHSPIGFTFYDEFLHWRTAADMLRTGRLFTENAMLPVSPMYPGIELVTTALTSITGLSIFHSGAIVIGVARLVQTLALFRFFTIASGSARVAGLAVMVYTCNPNYIFFGAQFAYESLALPLVAMILMLLLRHSQLAVHERFVSASIIVAFIGAVVVTHHASSYMLIGVLLLWTCAASVLGRLGYRQWHPGWFALAAFLLTLAWMLMVSRTTVDYLEPHVVRTFDAVVQLLSGGGTSRQLFQSATGEVAPLLERLVGIGSVLLLLIAMPLGLLRYWREYRGNACMTVMALLALAYPISLVMRFTGAGWETATRASATLFIGIGMIVALAITASWSARRLGRAFVPAVVASSVILFTGGIVAGWSPSSRLPRPYQVAAGNRSIEPNGILAAEWVEAALGPGNRVATDRTNMVLMGSYGEQRVVTNIQDQVTISNIFLAPSFNSYEQSIVQRGRIAYLVVDMRISTAMPIDDHYYEGWERIDNPYSAPIPVATLSKFDAVTGVSRIFDGGVIRIYDTGVYGREP